MRIDASRLLGLLLAGAVTLVACAPDTPDTPATTSRPSSLPEASGGRFVARLISSEPSMGPAVIAHLEDCYLPVWNRLRAEGIVTSVSVFELSPYDPAPPQTSDGDVLVLAELGPEAEPETLLDAERTSACPDRRDNPAFRVLRSALLSCTPNSCYGTPEPAYEDSPSGIDFLVEFIGVEEDPSALAKYREIMSEYAGPANGILLERGMLHCFLALENVELLSDTPGAVPWNQIHISDDWDEAVDWETVYEELFREEFERDLDSVFAELPSTDETRADYHGRLVSALCVR